MRIANKIPCFLVDYGIYDDCNLACHYCRLAPTKGTDNSDGMMRYIEGLTNVSQHVNAVMFKTSGWGEITLLPGYIQLFHHAKHLGYQVFQLITNGMSILTEAVLEELQNLGNFSLQMSIDGLNSDNKYRFRDNPILQERFFTNLHLALSMGIPVEINTVLTDANTASQHLFYDTLLQLREKYNTSIVCVPRRVKVKPGLNTQSLVPSAWMIDELEKTVIDRYSTYSPVLPPQPYLAGLIYYLRFGQRNWTSYDSLVRINIGASSDIVVHTTSGKRLLGSILGEDPSKSFVARSNIHNFGEPDYQTKVNQFDILYLYLGGKLSLSELSTIPSYSNPVSQNWLRHLRSIVLNAEKST